MYDMNERIDGVEKGVSVLRADVSELKTDVSILKSDVSVLKADVAVLKTDVTQLKTDVAVIRSNYSTKADIAQLETTLFKWGFGSVIALAGVVVAAAKYIH
jgi:archaellum component FlaC